MFTTSVTGQLFSQVYSPNCIECVSGEGNITEFDIYYKTTPKDVQFCYAIYNYYITVMGLTTADVAYYTNKTENGKNTVCAVFSQKKLY